MADALTNKTNTTNDEAPPPRLGVKIGKRVMRTADRFLAAHSTVPVTPFIDAGLFPVLAPLAGAWRAVDTELDALLVRAGDIPAFHQLSEDQVRISKGDNWKTFAFYVFGTRVDENCARCPQTAALLDGIDGLQNAWFSILAPHYRIPPHHGPSKAVVRAHLGLKVPEGKDCWLRVDSEYACWQAGEWLCFDDTYEHEVQNNTTETRVVLFLDLDRPLDRLGDMVRKGLLKLLRSSSYVQRPLANLQAWNRRLHAEPEADQGMPRAD